MKAIKKHILFTLIVSLLSTFGIAQNSEVFTLIVDAGHGGHDSGTVGNNKYKRYEKDVALSVALKFGKLVEKNLKDVKVVYTRKTDVFIKLIDRPKIANNNNANFFVSVHCNANSNTKVSGAETYVLGMHKSKDNFEVAKKENSVIFLEDDYSVSYENFDPNSVQSLIGLTLGQEEYLEKSLLLASIVQNNFKTKTALRSRGVKQAGFWVLARNYMPSVLIELGFLSNDKDAKYLMSTKGQDKVAQSLFLSFKEYKKYWDDQNKVGEDFEFETKVLDRSESKNKEVVVDKKEETPAKAVVATVVKKSDSIGKSEFEYAIQLLSSNRKIDLEGNTFKKVSNISYYKQGSIYKYVCNKGTVYKEVVATQGDVRKKGFSGAFVVAFKKGIRIPIKTALKEDKNN